MDIILKRLFSFIVVFFVGVSMFAGGTIKNVKKKAVDIVQSLSTRTLDGCSTVQIKNNKEEITIQIDMKGNWNVFRK